MKPVIFGISGHQLSADERAFFKDVDPLGYILFKRNCGDRAQMRALTDSLRELTGRADVPILIDQEGGAGQWPGAGDDACRGRRQRELRAAA
jgi:beta-N-acetylhexosaminidase